MADRTIRAKRRNALVMLAALVVVLAALLPGPSAKLELTTQRVSLLLESGPVRFRTLVFDSAQLARPIGLTLSIGRAAR